MAKAKLRHIALSVPDLEAAARFYMETFGMRRVNFASTPYGDGLSLSDGVVNLTLLKFHTDDAAGDERGKDFVGLHHMGFVVDDLEGTSAAIEHNGGRFHRELKGGGGVDFERKFRDPNGIVFDISHKGWVGAEGQVGSETGARRA
jgi:catechol 2,3-dioxygenase-like lactoylglutathione lyase family enzyme